MLICDFCISDNVAWLYPAVDVTFDFGGPVLHQSVGGWAACDACAQLIEAGDQEELVARAFEVWRQQAGADDVGVLAILRDLFVAFFESRSGPRQPRLG